MTIATTESPFAFDTHHDDVIHDAQVDFYGRRLATASSDRTIRIFQINQNQTETLLSILSGHEGPVWQVSWAHPKFGSILASCSYDGTVIVWKEGNSSSNLAPGQGPYQSSSEKTHGTWTKLKVHRAHESSVNSISFSPHEYGLNLACASSDGKVSVLTMSESGEWLTQTFVAHQSGCNSVSWCSSAVPSTILALDFNALEQAPVKRDFMRIATGGCDNTVKIWKFSDATQWELEASLNGHKDWVRDVCWRPNIGQNGRMLVTCSQDNTVLIWKQESKNGEWNSISLKPEAFADTLWRVSFSEYGNLLSVSCGDNTVTIWREVSETGHWELVGNVDENVTESVKVSEPLAVSPPTQTPLPNLIFESATIVSSVIPGTINAIVPEIYQLPVLEQSILPETNYGYEPHVEPTSSVAFEASEPTSQKDYGNGHFIAPEPLYSEANNYYRENTLQSDDVHQNNNQYASKAVSQGPYEPAYDYNTEYANQSNDASHQFENGGNDASHQFENGFNDDSQQYEANDASHQYSGQYGIASPAQHTTGHYETDASQYTAQYKADDSDQYYGQYEIDSSNQYVNQYPDQYSANGTDQYQYPDQYATEVAHDSAGGYSNEQYDQYQQPTEISGYEDTTQQYEYDPNSNYDQIPYSNDQTSTLKVSSDDTAF